MSDDVIPFDRKRRVKQPPAAPPAPGPDRARELAAQQGRERLSGYQKALAPQWQARNRAEEERLLRDEKPIPARITMALDLRGLYGPEVDAACGAAEPAVDMWECGVEVPTPEQVKLLAELTGCPVPYFYLPVQPGPQLPGMFICSTGKKGCDRPEPDIVDEHGVLHYGGEPRRVPPAATQGTLF